jgi:hypothetical protein
MLGLLISSGLPECIAAGCLMASNVFAGRVRKTGHYAIDFFAALLVEPLGAGERLNASRERRAA